MGSTTHEAPEAQVHVFHLRGTGNRPVATLASRMTEPGTIQVGFALCNPKDSFFRNVGRQKAMGRLQSGKEHFFEVSVKDNESIKYVVLQQFKDVIRPDVGAYTAALNWLMTHENSKPLQAPAQAQSETSAS